MAVWGLILTVYFSTHPQAILDTPHHSYSNISHLYSNLSHPNIRVPEINRIKENPFSAPANFEEIQFPVLISNLIRQSYNIRQYFFRRRNRHWWIANGKHQTTDRSYVRPENAAQNWPKWAIPTQSYFELTPLMHITVACYLPSLMYQSFERWVSRRCWVYYLHMLCPACTPISRRTSNLYFIIKHIYVACGFFRVFCAYIIKFVFTVISIVKVAVMCYVKCVICLLRHIRCTSC